MTRSGSLLGWFCGRRWRGLPDRPHPAMMCLRAFVVALAAFAWATACDDPSTSTDGNTSWLRSCSTVRDCGGGLSCTCGVCTKQCSMASDCRALDDTAACWPSSGAPACAEASGAICTRPCTSNAECTVGGAPLVCRDGFCAPEAATPPLDGGGDASVGDASGAMGEGGSADVSPAASDGADALLGDSAPVRDAGTDGLLADAASTATGALSCVRAADSQAADGVALAPDGSLFVVGRFQGSATLGLGELRETTLSGFGGDDGFVAHFNPDCTLDWAKAFGGPGFDMAEGVGVSPDGSVAIVVGRFADSATLGSGETNATVLTESGLGDALVAAFSAITGELVWAKSAGGSNPVDARDVKVRNDGTFVMTGRACDLATFGTGEPGESSVGAAGGGCLPYVASYRADGFVSWVRSPVLGLNGWGEARGIAAAADGSAYIAGTFSGPLTFGQGEAGETTFASADSSTYEMFVAGYEPSGALRWAKHAVKTAPGGVGADVGNAIAFDESTQTVVVAGSLGDMSGVLSETAFGPGEPGEVVVSGTTLDAYIARYRASDGMFIWVRRTEGPDDESATAVGVAADGSLVATGYFLGSATFGTGESAETTFAGGGAFVARHRADGSLMWARAFGPLTGAASYQATTTGIAVAQDGRSYVVGSFETTFDTVSVDAFFAALEP